MKIKLNGHNAILTLRRVIGISILLILMYWIGNFFIKFIAFSLYVGTGVVDKIFRTLLGV